MKTSDARALVRRFLATGRTDRRPARGRSQIEDEREAAEILVGWAQAA